MKRNAKIWIAVLLLCFSNSGCHKAQPPTASGGKQTSYWVAAITNSNMKARKRAVFELGNAGAADPIVIPALTKALKDSDPVVRREAVIALTKCGKPATDARPALIDAQAHDRDSKVRDSATRALQQLGP
jgi:hypothetical protein